MDWHKLWSDYQTLIVAVASVIATMIAKQILPWLWKNIVARAWVFIARHSGSRWRTRSFRKNYLNWLIEENRYLEIRGLRTRAPISIELEDVYVSLKAKSTQYSQSDLLKKTDSEIANEHESIPVLKALTQNKRIVILGHPGSGKTTLLRFLAVTFARLQRAAKNKGDNRKLLQKRLDGYWGSQRNRFGFVKANDIPFPLYMPLRAITIDEISDGSALNECFLGRYFKDDYPNDFVNNIFRDGKCIVLFDGLDEVRGNEGRRKIVEWIEELVAHYPENRYVVASRIVGYSTPLAGGFKTLTLEDFNNRDITRFIQAWYQTVEMHSKEQNPIVLYHAKESADALIRTILNNRKIRHLAINPLMLSIIALVHRYRTKLPERRVDLYDECTQVLLGYWDEAKGIAGDLPPVKKRLTLEPIAHKMQIQNSPELTRVEIEQILESELPKIGGTKDDTKDFVDEIRERSGLLVERGPDVFSFSHLTFQEYLSASHVCRNSKESLLLDHVNDDRWHEVILLYCGMTDATEFVKTLLSIPDDIFHSHFLLAGRCINEALKIDASTKRNVTTQLQELLFTSPFKACRTTISSVLQRLDPQATLKLLLKKCEDSDKSSRTSLIEALSYFADFLTEEACLKLLNDTDIGMKVMMLRALTKRNTLSDELVEAIVKQISDNNANVRLKAVSCLHNKSQYIVAYKALTQALLFDEDASVRSAVAEVLENYDTHSNILIYIGLGIFDREGRVAILSGNTLLHLWFNLKWYRIVHITFRSFLEVIKFLPKAELRH
ncbi:HEAT repeat domain-containing protein [bacterium]|nr:HEAT repeat domain-containing protein [bacterium]